MLHKIEREKEIIRQQLSLNERIMQERMELLARERDMVEQQVNWACIKIQSFFRMKIARKKFLRHRDLQRADSKLKLHDLLNQMEHEVAKRKHKSVTIDSAAERIQRAARKMINRIRFRNCLYRLILLQNIVENKIYKEKMQMLFAFEQLIINTETDALEVADDLPTEKSVENSVEINLKAQEANTLAGDDREKSSERQSARKMTNTERLKDQIMKMTNVSSSMSGLILDALLIA